MNFNKIILGFFIFTLILVLASFGYLLISNQMEKKTVELEEKAKTIREVTDSDQEKTASPRVLTIPNQPKAEKNSSIYLKTDQEEKKEFALAESFNLIVMVSAQEQVVDGAEFFLSYDPSLIEAGELVPGTFFSLYPQKKIDKEKGTIRIMALQASNENNKLGQEILVTIPFTAKQKGIITFTFDQKETHIVGYGGQELLEETKELTITIK